MKYLCFLILLSGCGDMSLSKEENNYSCSTIQIDSNITEVNCQSTVTYAIGNICLPDVIANGDAFIYVCSSQFPNQNCIKGYAEKCGSQ